MMSGAHSRVGETFDPTQDITALCCVAGYRRHVAARGRADHFARPPGLGSGVRKRHAGARWRPFVHACHARYAGYARHGAYARHAPCARYAGRSCPASGSLRLLRAAFAHAAAFGRSRRPSSGDPLAGDRTGHVHACVVARTASAQRKSAGATVHPAGMTLMQPGVHVVRH